MPSEKEFGFIIHFNKSRDPTIILFLNIVSVLCNTLVPEASGCPQKKISFL
jgi:hypothetical protein